MRSTECYFCLWSKSDSLVQMMQCYWWWWACCCWSVGVGWGTVRSSELRLHQVLFTSAAIWHWSGCQTTCWVAHRSYWSLQRVNICGRRFYVPRLSSGLSNFSLLSVCCLHLSGSWPGDSTWISPSYSHTHHPVSQLWFVTRTDAFKPVNYIFIRV